MEKLYRETPEVKSWIYSFLRKKGIRLPTIEGFSVRAEKVTALSKDLGL